MPEVPDHLVITARAALAEGLAEADGTRPRSISATLASYGTARHPISAWGGAVRLMPGAIEEPAVLSDVKLQRYHNDDRIIGVMSGFEQDDEQVRGTFRLARTADADEAFVLAQDGILDAVSMGYRIHDASPVVEDGQDILEVTRASLFEVSLVGHPADDTARISAVTARKADPVNDIPTQLSPAPDEATPSAQLLDTVLAHVRDNLAPATATPVAAQEPREVRLVDGDGNAIALAHERNDPRIPAVIGRDHKRYTAGDFFASYARGVNEGDWTRHHEIRAALADELTSDVPGLLPQQIIGELLGRASGRRPVWGSFTPRDMPMTGEKFSRPMITQHVAVGPQATQKTQVATQKYTVALNDVPKITLAGALDVAQQAIDWTSPSLLNELILDFTRIYISRTDQKAADDLIAAQTKGAESVAWDGTAATFATALAAAAAAVAANAPVEADAMPNTLWLSLDMWAQLAGLTDTTGRQLLPQLGPMNATGTTDLSRPETGGLQIPGFNVVVSKRFPEQTIIVGDSNYLEAYENGRRFLQAVRPDVLGLDIAYMGYTATYAPYPTTLVKITLPAPTAAATTNTKS